MFFRKRLPAGIRLLKKTAKTIKQCGPKGNKGPKENDVKGSLKENEQKVYNELLKEHMRTARAIARWIRGSLCALCIPPAEIANFFDENGNLFVNQEDIDAYLTELSNAL